MVESTAEVRICYLKKGSISFHTLDELGAVVFDVGQYSFRAGFAGEDCPKTEVPCTVGLIDDGNARMDIDAMPDQNGNSLSAPSTRRYIFGTTGIKSPQANMELISFLKDGMGRFYAIFIRFFYNFYLIVEDWDLFEKMTDYIYQKHLNLDPTLHPVLFSEASVCTCFFI